MLEKNSKFQTTFFYWDLVPAFWNFILELFQNPIKRLTCSVALHVMSEELDN